MPIYTAVPTLNKSWLKMRRIFENGKNTSTLLFVLPTVSLQQLLGIGTTEVLENLVFFYLGYLVGVLYDYPTQVISLLFTSKKTKN
jgi:uncharacterized membrane protein YqaE (UPF0057 family)